MIALKEHGIFRGFGDRKVRLAAGAGISLILCLALVLSAVNNRIGRLVKKRSAREAEVAEMLILKQRYLEAKVSSQRTANRLATVRPDDSPAKIFEEIGIRGKNSQLRQMK